MEEIMALKETEIKSDLKYDGEIIRVERKLSVWLTVKLLTVMLFIMQKQLLC